MICNTKTMSYIDETICYEIHQTLEKIQRIINDYVNERYEIIVSYDIYQYLINKYEIVTKYNNKFNHTLYGMNLEVDGKLFSKTFTIKYKGDEYRMLPPSLFRWYCMNDEEEKLPKKVMINKKKRATTLLFEDDTIVVKKSKDDKEDYEKAFLWAYFLYKSGMSKTQANKYIKGVMEKNEIK